MPVLPFETSFLVGWSEWDCGNFGGTDVFSSRATPYPKYGKNNGPCATCMDYAPVDANGAQFTQCLVGNCHKGGAGDQFGADPGYPSISFRMQFSIACNDLTEFNTESGTLRIVYFYCIADRNTSGAMPHVQLYVTNDSRLRLNIWAANNPGSGSSTIVPYPPVDQSTTMAVYVQTPANTIPFDGVNHAIVVNLVYTNHSSLHYTLIMDGITLLDADIAAGPYHCGGKWGMAQQGQYFGLSPSPANCQFFNCPSEFFPQSGTNAVIIQTHRRPTCGFAKLLTRIAHVSIIETPTPYPVDTTIPVLTLNGCAVNFEDMIVDALGNLTIRGFNFPPGMTFTLQGPGGVDTGFDIISQGATEIVIGNLNPPFVEGAKYCIKGPCI